MTANRRLQGGVKGEAKDVQQIPDNSAPSIPTPIMPLLCQQSMWPPIQIQSHCLIVPTVGPHTGRLVKVGGSLWRQGPGGLASTNAEARTEHMASLPWPNKCTRHPCTSPLPPTAISCPPPWLNKHPIHLSIQAIPNSCPGQAWSTPGTQHCTPHLGQTKALHSLIMPPPPHTPALAKWSVTAGFYMDFRSEILGFFGLEW